MTAPHSPTAQVAAQAGHRTGGPAQTAPPTGGRRGQPHRTGVATADKSHHTRVTAPHSPTAHVAAQAGHRTGWPAQTAPPTGGRRGQPHHTRATAPDSPTAHVAAQAGHRTGWPTQTAPPTGGRRGQPHRTGVATADKSHHTRVTAPHSPTAQVAAQAGHRTGWPTQTAPPTGGRRGQPRLIGGRGRRSRRIGGRRVRGGSGFRGAFVFRGPGFVVGVTSPCPVRQCAVA
ncbi:hypothetical protein GCM10023257_02090 [Streptomyces hyderabadensis]|uniref:Uncharacterized protein n=1 Tax=Streptomyces hyderabadensis TaxID=598549 RepID=A0ABP9HFV1_9ACTN